ncbi:DUF1343 domain-containing protein [bacterium]|nr:DUF1343 domain-containing protein [bacterium]
MPPDSTCQTTSGSSPVRTGLDLFAENAPHQGLSIGLVCNQASVTYDLRHCIDVITERSGNCIRVIFAPEHGVFGDQQAQEAVRDGRDERDGPALKTIYGHHLAPDQEMLGEIDTLVFDLQDIGARYYTFVWTMLHCMRACKVARTPIVVLDRPNPLNGITLEGNMLDGRFASFVGMHPIPIRHGMTIGELGGLLNSEQAIHCDLRVVKMKNWERNTYFNETGLIWIQPSPNMPTLDTALVYPGMCLLEGTNISEGRGTTRPFELFGAPFIDADALVKRLDSLMLPGVRFLKAGFRPTFDKYSGKLCRGVQLHVLNKETFKSYLTGIAVVSAVRQLHPEHFQWKTPPYEFETERLPFDILTGTDKIRLAIESDMPIDQIESGWQQELEQFRSLREKFLLY